MLWIADTPCKAPGRRGLACDALQTTDRCRAHTTNPGSEVPKLDGVLLAPGTALILPIYIATHASHSPGSEVSKLEGDIAAAMEALKQLETDAMEVRGLHTGLFCPQPGLGACFKLPTPAHTHQTPSGHDAR